MSTDKEQATQLADHIRIDQDWCEEAAALLRRWPDAGEPFCYMRQTSSERNPPHGWAVYFSGQLGDVPLYTAPPAKPDGEPVAWADAIIDDLHALHDSELISEIDSGDALIRLDDAIAAVEDARGRHAAPPAESERIAELEAALAERDERISAADAVGVRREQRIMLLEAVLDFAHRALNNPTARDFGDAVVRKIEEVKR